MLPWIRSATAAEGNNLCVFEHLRKRPEKSERKTKDSVFVYIYHITLLGCSIFELVCLKSFCVILYFCGVTCEAPSEDSRCISAYVLRGLDLWRGAYSCVVWDMHKLQLFSNVNFVILLLFDSVPSSSLAWRMCRRHDEMNVNEEKHGDTEILSKWLKYKLQGTKHEWKRSWLNSEFTTGYQSESILEKKCCLTSKAL